MQPFHAMSVLVLSAALAACFRLEPAPQPDGFNPEYFGTDAERCSGRKLAGQGFSGAMKIGTVIEFSGSVVSAGRKFNIYYYDFVDKANDRETRRILVLDDTCGYLGSYPTDHRPTGTSGPDLLFGLPEESGSAIHFGNGKVPGHVRLGGQVRDLRK